MQDYNSDRYVFVDLDETLIHGRCLYIRDEKPKSNEKLMDFGTERRPDRYASALRGGALELLAKLRELCPGRVFMLTVSVRDYAMANNTIHGLGFEQSEIFSREHCNDHRDYPIKKLNFDHLTVSPSAYLLDNLPRCELGGKLCLLQRLGFMHGNVETIKIRDYMGSPENDPTFDEFTQSDIDSIVGTVLAKVEV